MTTHTMQMAAQKVSERLAKALPSAQKTTPANDPAARLLASMPRPSTQQKTSSKATEILAACVAASKSRNNANSKGSKT